MTLTTTDSARLDRPSTRQGRALVAGLTLLVAFDAAAQEDRVWESLGPRVITNSNEITGITDREVVGAVNSVAPHPSDADEMFIGGVNSGVWRTDNATSASPVWHDVSGDLPSLSIGAVAYDMADPSFDTVLVGAGRYSSFGRLGGSPRFGIYRTQNRGVDWVDIDGTALDGRSVNAISANGNLVLVSTGGNVAGPGLFLGQNTGGAWQWTQLSGRVPTGAAAAILPAGTTFDLEADPTTAGRYYTMNASGVFRATLPAATPEDAAWTKVSSAAVDGQLATAAHGRLAVGPGGQVFVAISTGGTVLSSLWRSPDGSTGWQSLDTPITSPLGVWFLALAADPTNGNVAYVGGGGRESEYRVDASLASGSQAFRITRGGTSSDSRPHADVRDMSFDANGDLIEGNDGGVYKQTNPADATGDWLSLNGNLLATEYYELAWDAVSHVAMGGAIDNGTSIQNGFVRDRWLHIHGGDGGDAAINDTGSAVQSQRYTSSQELGGFTRRTYDQNNTQLATNAAPMTPPTCDGGLPCFTPNWPFVTPVAVNVVNPVRLVAGGSNGVFESTDQGQNAVQLLDGGGAAVPSINSNGSADPVAAGADGNADALYLGSGDAVWVRTAGGFGSAMTRTDPSATRTGNIVDVVIDPGDDQSAFAIDGGAVFWTSNAGTSWTDISGNLATATTATLRSVAYSTSNTDGAVIVGTDNGVFIARGDGSSVNDASGDPIPFTDWTALGVGLPAAPVYDLEYDPADELLIAGTLGRGAWAVNMEERDPIDVALVLDKSGSMGDPACPGCDSKMVVLQDAAELFIQTWQMLSDADDRIAAVFFDSLIDTFSASGDQLVTLTSSGDDVISYIRSKSDGGATAMGGGAQTAINLLTDASRPRSLIILTDGMQNRDPMIELQGGVYEIRNTGRTGSGVAPTVPPTRLDVALDIKVNTIGVGVTPAYEAELSAISGGTTGLHKTTTDANADLRRFYIEQLVDALRDASPQLIDYRYARVGAGGTDEQSFGINPGAKKVVFSVSWHRRDAGRLAVAIFKDGRNVTELVEESRRGSFYEVVSFDTSGRPVAGRPRSALSSDGEWAVRVQGSGGVDYEVAALADHGTLDYEFEATPRLLQAGDTTVLTAEVQLNGLPHGDDVAVRVEIGVPQEGIATALALTPTPPGIVPEDGETPAEAKLRYLLLHSPEFRERISRRRSSKALARTAAGRFSAPFADTTVAGTYKLSFLLEGSGPRTGEFERREERFFVVEAGPFASGSSAIQTIDVATAAGVTTTTIRIRPRDIHGNYLGPDQKDDVGASVPGTGETAVVTDVGDGWYELVLTTSSSDPDIQITIGGGVVATGKPNEIDVEERPPIVTGRPPGTGPPTGRPCGTAPDVRLTGSTDYGVVSAWRPAERTVSVCNLGECPLSGTSVSIDCTAFAPVADPLPASLPSGACLDLVVRFTPSAEGTTTCELTVATDDPDSPVVRRTLTARTPPFFSLHAGLVDPQGALGAVARQGSTFNLDLVHHFRPRWAWEVRLGYSKFDGRAGFGDTDLWNLSANARFTANPTDPARFFLNGGLGLYHLDPGDLEGGGNLGLGLNVPVGRRFAFEVTYNYHSVFTASPSLEFGQLQGGLLVSF